MIDTNLEIEYKCMITYEEYKRIIDNTNFDEVIEQFNTYFVSANEEDKKGAIRIRRIKDTYELCIKTNTEKGKLEHNVIVPSNSVKEFDKNEIVDLLSSLDIKYPITSLGELKTTRHNITTDIAVISIDKNEYLDTVDYEVEYELKNNEIDGLPYFKEFLFRYDITYVENQNSKRSRFKAQLKK